MRHRRGRRWFMALMLVALLLGLLLGRLVKGPAHWLEHPQLLSVAEQSTPLQLHLQLQLDRPLEYRLERQGDSWRIWLPGVQMGDAQRGLWRTAQGRLSWQLRPQSDGVQLLLVSLGGPLQVSPQAERNLRGWLLELQMQWTGDEQ